HQIFRSRKGGRKRKIQTEHIPQGAESDRIDSQADLRADREARGVDATDQGRPRHRSGDSSSLPATSDREPCSRDEVLYIWIMDPAALLENPPPPTLVVTPWSGSRGQDLLGLRAPAERIANDLMDGVT